MDAASRVSPWASNTFAYCNHALAWLARLDPLELASARAMALRACWVAGAKLPDARCARLKRIHSSKFLGSMRTARSINTMACLGWLPAKASSAADKSAKVALVLVFGAAGLGVGC